MGSNDSDNSDFFFPVSSPSLSSQDEWDDDLHAYLGWYKSHELNQIKGSSSLVPAPNQSTSENLTFYNIVSMGEPLLQTGVNDFVNDFSQGQILPQNLSANVGSPNINPQILYPQQQSANPTEGFYPQKHSSNPTEEIVLNNSPEQNTLKEDSFGGVDDYPLSCILSQSVNSPPNESAEQPKGKLPLLPSRSGSNRSNRAKPYDRAPQMKGSKHVKEITQGTRKLFASPSWHKDGNFSDLLHRSSRLSRISSSGNLSISMSTTRTTSGPLQHRIRTTSETLQPDPGISSSGNLSTRMTTSETLQPNPGTRVSSSSRNLRSSSSIATPGTLQTGMMTTSGTLQPNPETRISSSGNLSTTMTDSGTLQPRMVATSGTLTTSGTLQPNTGTRISSSDNLSTNMMVSGTLQPRMVTTSGTLLPNTGKRISSPGNLSTRMMTSAASQPNPGTRISSSSVNLTSTRMMTSGTLQPRMMTTSGILQPNPGTRISSSGNLSTRMTTSGTLQPNPGTSSEGQGIHDGQGSSSLSRSQDGRITSLVTQTSRQESKKGGAPGGNSQKQDNTNCGLNQLLQPLEEGVALYLARRHSLKNRDPANQIPSSSLPKSLNPRTSHDNFSFHHHRTNDVALANQSLNQNLSCFPECYINPMSHGNSSFQHHETNQNPISSFPEISSNNPMFQGNSYSLHDGTEGLVPATQSPSQTVESETNCVPSLEDQEEKSDFLMWTEQIFMETQDQNNLDF